MLNAEREYRKPIFVSTLQDIYAVRGCDVTVTSIVIGKPKPETHWYLNGEKVDANDPEIDVRQDDDGKYTNLIIHNIDPDVRSAIIDVKCIAVNQLGQDETSATLTVTENSETEICGSGITFLENLSDLKTFVGETVMFKVKVQGTPPIEVIWVHNDQPIKDSVEYRYTYEGDGVQSLKLFKVKLEDCGLYVCEAYNEFGNSESLCILTVLDSNKNSLKKLEEVEDFTNKNENTGFNSKKIVKNVGNIHDLNINSKDTNESNLSTNLNDDIFITEKMDDIEVAKGENAEFRYDSTEPIINWFPDEKKMQDSSDTNMEVVDNCLNSTSGHLSLKESGSKVKILAPIIRKGPESKTVMRGEKVIMRAQFTSSQSSSLSWLKGGKIVESSERIWKDVYETSTVLTILDVQADDSGKYIVSIQNEAGTACHFASLAVEGIPEPPAEPPQVTNVSRNSLTLSWYGSVYDGGSILTGYTIEMLTLKQEDNWRVLVSGCHSTSHVVQGLEPEKEYQFRIRAQNVHGISRPGKHSKFIRTLREAIINLPTEDEPKSKMEIEREWIFKEIYDVKEELGRGRFGTVHRVIDKRNGDTKAAKFIKCFKVKDKMKVLEEIEIMNDLRHTKLLQLEGAYNNDRQVIVVLEYIAGGELFERVVAEDFTLTEKDAILFMHQIIDGVTYMHANYIMHLDLKPENILCKSRTGHQIKIIDFGLAKRYDPKTSTRVLFGTPEFIAPEIINYEPISLASDMWSLGVICYVLLSGLSPFMGENDAETFTNITRSDYDFDEESFDTVTEEAKDFITQLLVKNQRKRLTAEKCMKHRWLAQHQRTMSNVALPTNKLKKFIIRRKWHKTGTAIRALTRMTQMCGKLSLGKKLDNDRQCSSKDFQEKMEEDGDSGHESLGGSHDDHRFLKMKTKLRKALLRKKVEECSSSSGDSFDISINIPFQSNNFS